MINAQYKLIKPYTIETFYSNINFDPKNILVRPEMLSICKADMRYFFGMRDAKILRQRLPLSLIHEAAGTVLYDPSGEFRTGERVVLLPNIPGEDGRYEENYRLDSLFRSSRADGFMQEIMSLPSSQLISYQEIPLEVAAFTEFISVGVHAVTTYMERRKNVPRRIGIWGDGGLGYIVAALIKCMMPDVAVAVTGVGRTKLALFSFADESYTVDEIAAGDIWFDDVFECVGGQASENAVEQMIDVIRPEGLIMLLGVSENPIAVNTRMVLEKGLTLIGRSRSGRTDFLEAVRLLETDKRFRSRMGKLVSDVPDVRSVGDISRAFDRARIADFKVVMNWRL